MDLERKLVHGNLSKLDQIKTAEAFLKENRDLDKKKRMDKFRQIVKVCKLGVSRFEWVDSVLLKAIEYGEWAVFENANMCNPSILDRLNPLLEENNASMVINEQGMRDDEEKDAADQQED